MSKVRVTLYEVDSRKRERIIDIKDFNNRIEAQEFLQNHKAEPRNYKLIKGLKTYTLS